jgi:hypothetical protein
MVGCVRVLIWPQPHIAQRLDRGLRIGQVARPHLRARAARAAGAVLPMLILGNSAPPTQLTIDLGD